MDRRGSLKALGAGWSLLAGRGAVAQEQRPALVAVAASVQRAMEEIAPAWTRSTGHRLRISYGSSGNFVRQIQRAVRGTFECRAPGDQLADVLDAFARQHLDRGGPGRQPAPRHGVRPDLRRLRA